jgi:diguanylate cyclase
VPDPASHIVDLRDLRLDTAHALVAQASGSEAALRRDQPSRYLQGLIDGLCELSLKDHLTGLANRRHFRAVLEREIDRVTRSGEAALLLMLDIDHFKQINDQHGHTVGDEVLRALARIVLSNVRATDCAGRYGGDEFAIVLRGMHLDGATAVAHRIREQVQALQLHDMPGLQFTTSMGVATADHRHSSLRAWTNAADAELYQAKAAGRNRVSASSMPDMAPVV